MFKTSGQRARALMRDCLRLESESLDCHIESNTLDSGRYWRLARDAQRRAYALNRPAAKAEYLSLDEVPF